MLSACASLACHVCVDTFPIQLAETGCLVKSPLHCSLDSAGECWPNDRRQRPPTASKMTISACGWYLSELASAGCLHIHIRYKSAHLFVQITKVTPQCVMAYVITSGNAMYKGACMHIRCLTCICYMCQVCRRSAAAMNFSVWQPSACPEQSMLRLTWQSVLYLLL